MKGPAGCAACGWRTRPHKAFGQVRVRLAVARFTVHGTGSWLRGKREMFGKPSLRELANKAGQAGFASCASLCAANLRRGFS